MTIIAYIIRRVVLLVPTLIFLILMVFVLFRAVPGDPARLAAGRDTSEEKVQQMREELMLDVPLYIQFFSYTKDVVTFKFGKSAYTGRRVILDIGKYLSASLELGTLSLLFAIIIGIPLGIISAVSHNRWADHIARALAISGVSIPVFWLGLIALWVFYLHLGWFPWGGRISFFLSPPDHITGLYVIDSILTNNLATLKSSIWHLVLPVITLGVALIAYISRMTRSSMLEVLRQDYIQTAKSKGLSKMSVIFKHAFRNAMGPVLTSTGYLFAHLLGGVVLTETIFSWPGIGLYLVEAIMRLDIKPILGFTLFAGLIYVIINLLVDILYFYINPKMKV